MRYVRQIEAKPIGADGQQKIREARVAIVGAGALGSVVAEQLVRAGIGQLTIIDNDVVELQNLQRQVLYTERDVGMPKVDAICRHLRSINSDVDVNGMDMKIDDMSELPSCLLIDCTDNFAAARSINRWCIGHSLPWVHGSAAGTRGTVISFEPRCFCFECIYGDQDTNETALTSGMIGSTAALVASLQVVEALKIILGEGCSTMLLVNSWDAKIKRLHIKRRRGCICQRKSL